MKYRYVTDTPQERNMNVTRGTYVAWTKYASDLGVSKFS